MTGGAIIVLMTVRAVYLQGGIRGRTEADRVSLQLVLVRRRRHGGYGTHEAARRTAHHPPALYRAGEPALDPQGFSAGGGRCAGQRLPSRRLPLQRGQLFCLLYTSPSPRD